MEVKAYTPHAALREYVLTISTVNARLPDGIHEVVTPYPPPPFQSLIFYCNHRVLMGHVGNSDFTIQPSSVLIGPQVSRVNIKVVKQLTAVRVDFLPGGLYRLLGTPMNELLDKGFDTLDFFGAGMKTVNEQMLNLTSLEEGKNVVEKFLLDRVNKRNDKLPFDFAIHAMLKSDGKMTIEQTASMACLSVKQFERKCKERIGMNPKMYGRILRFSKAYRLHEAFPQHSWIEVAYDAGYYDQMHMIRDFRDFAGVNPSVIERELLSTPLRMQRNLYY